MNPYLNTCPHCNSPAKRNRDVLICSNVKCKSWKSIRKLSANVDHSKIKQEQGLTSDDPVIIICPKCDKEAQSSRYKVDPNYAFCWYCGRQNQSFGFFSYTYIVNRWYKYRYGRKGSWFVQKYIGGEDGRWDELIEINQV